MTFERFEPAKLDASKLAAYAGRYESSEMTHDFEVVVKTSSCRPAPGASRTSCRRSTRWHTIRSWVVAARSPSNATAKERSFA